MMPSRVLTRGPTSTGCHALLASPGQRKSQNEGVDELPAYQDSLSAVAKVKPAIAASLARAQQLRAERLARYVGGMRLAGLEQLYLYLDAAHASYLSSPSLAGIAFLVRRVRADYETALEATLSGFTGVAGDAMRDVMEIEGLLLDFASNEDHMQEWLHADRMTLINKFGPGAIRKRLKAAGVKPYSNEGFEPLDYQAHSQALHVSPPNGSVSSRGIDADNPSMFDDLGFIEMFEHGNRILFALEFLRVVGLGLVDTENYEPLVDRSDFDAAYKRTEQMQVIVIAMMTGPRVLRDRLGRDPKTSEVLTFIADELSAQSPSSPGLDAPYDRET